MSNTSKSTNLELIRDAGKLNKFVTMTMRTYASNGERLHVAVVSAILNACEGGNPAVLNRIQSDLRTNDNTALRQYIRRLHIAIGNSLVNGVNDFIVPEGLTQEEYQHLAEAGKVFEYKQKEFHVANGRMNQREHLASACGEYLINPDGKKWTRFLDRNTLAEVKKFGDADIVKAIDGLIKKSEGSEKVEASVSDEMMELLQSVSDKAHSLVDAPQVSATAH